MMENAKFTLGATDYEVQPLTLDQLQEIGIGAAGLTSPVGHTAAGVEKEWYDNTFKVLSVALGKPEEELRKFKGVSRPQLFEASRQIFLMTGLLTDKKKSGEAPQNTGEERGAAVTG